MHPAVLTSLRSATGATTRLTAEIARIDAALASQRAVAAALAARGLLMPSDLAQQLEAVQARRAAAQAELDNAFLALGVPEALVAPTADGAPPPVTTASVLGLMHDLGARVDALHTRGAALIRPPARRDADEEEDGEDAEAMDVDGPVLAGAKRKVPDSPSLGGPAPRTNPARTLRRLLRDADTKLAQVAALGTRLEGERTGAEQFLRGAIARLGEDAVLARAPVDAEERARLEAAETRLTAALAQVRTACRRTATRKTPGLRTVSASSSS
jgi:hypothetical protein